MRKLVVPALVALSALFVAPQASAQNAAAPTFNKDVAPILFANCTSCHRPGDIAPMSLLTYKDARPWAKAIATQGRRRHDAAVARRSEVRHASWVRVS